MGRELEEINEAVAGNIIGLYARNYVHNKIINYTIICIIKKFLLR